MKEVASHSEDITSDGVKGFYKDCASLLYSFYCLHASEEAALRAIITTQSHMGATAMSNSCISSTHGQDHFREHVHNHFISSKVTQAHSPLWNIPNLD